MKIETLLKVNYFNRDQFKASDYTNNIIQVHYTLYNRLAYVSILLQSLRMISLFVGSDVSSSAKL